MGASAAVAAAVIAAVSTTYSAVEHNQEVQHQKGAQQAEQTRLNAQIAEANAKDKSDQDTKAAGGSATQTAALAALRASMSGSSGMGGTILTSPTGASTAPIATKTLLGA